MGASIERPSRRAPPRAARRPLSDLRAHSHARTDRGDQPRNGPVTHTNEATRAIEGTRRGIGRGGPLLLESARRVVASKPRRRIPRSDQRARAHEQGGFGRVHRVVCASLVRSDRCGRRRGRSGGVLSPVAARCPNHSSSSSVSGGSLLILACLSCAAGPTSSTGVGTRRRAVRDRGQLDRRRALGGRRVEPRSEQARRFRRFRVCSRAVSELRWF